MTDGTEADACAKDVHLHHHQHRRSRPRTARHGAARLEGPKPPKENVNGPQVLGAEPRGDTTTDVSRFQLRDTLSSNSDSTTPDDFLVSRHGVDGKDTVLAPGNTGVSPPSDALRFN